MDESHAVVSASSSSEQTHHATELAQALASVFVKLGRLYATGSICAQMYL
jgi:hypothetical protein